MAGEDAKRLKAGTVEPAGRYGRYGYRRIAALLRRADWSGCDRRQRRYDRLCLRLTTRP